jgi:prepilin-type N-terminal cleavage/methylation domain-containing protein/prepilin-type processing-associated H-X9-DG protein
MRVNEDRVILRKQVKEPFNGIEAWQSRRLVSVWLGRRLSDRGLTLIELVVVVFILGALGATLLTGLAKSGPTSASFQCLNNNRRLCLAWRMYADESHDQLVYSSDDGTGVTNPRNQYAWTQAHMDFNGSNRSNWDPTYDLVKRPLWPYTGRDPSIYKCPSDKSFVNTSGGAKPRIRSMSMNLYLGGFAGTSGGWTFIGSNYIYTNLTQIQGGLRAPGPAKMFVFLDQRADSINWGNFLTDMSGYSPSNATLFQFSGDFPGMYHNQSCSYSFADGHGEIHRWRDPRTTPPTFLSTIATSTMASPGNQDIAWLQDHSTRPR